MIFNIQKCSIHDGNGLRTLVFFKGCPLRCVWCANPESQSYTAEVMESQNKCIGCNACFEVCPKSAVQIKADGFRIDRDLCNNCLMCSERCYAASKYSIGKDYEIEELYKEIEKDRVFYSIKGGGVTFSGGEPLTHPDYLTKISKKCHEGGINVVLESCGYGKYEEFKSALPYIDSMFLDIKQIDSNKHKEITGYGNELILDNIKRIAQFGIKITVRTPVVPGLTDAFDNIAGIAKFLVDIPEIAEYELLPYHALGKHKYHALGREYALEELNPPSDRKMRELVKCANELFAGHNKVCFYTIDNQKVIVK